VRPIFFFLLLATSPVEDTAGSSPQEDTQEDSASDKCKDKAEALKNDMMGLEFFLQDKKDYKTYCPYNKWKQPALVTYKKEPKSYLPKGCKAEKI